jgi:hypothetical protein
MRAQERYYSAGKKTATHKYVPDAQNPSIQQAPMDTDKYEEYEEEV